MQGVFAISGSWHDPFPGLKRAAALLIAVAALEVTAVLLQHQLPFVPPVYVLGLLRVLDIVLLGVWGSWPFSTHYLLRSLRDSIPLAAFLFLCGILFLVMWKSFFGHSLFVGKGGAIFLLTSCLLAPLAEELVFRGILYRIAREWWNAVFCTILISLLFAVLHYAFHQDPLLPFCGSLLFCLVYEKAKSILSPILVHILGNLLIFLFPLAYGKII